MTEKRKLYERDRIILKTGLIGILVNFVLAGIKVLIGLLADSIAIILDGVNNLSDGIASVVTIIGNRLAGKAADKEHPLGHGRIEYMSTLTIAAIIIYVAITAAVESIKKIMVPQVADYSVWSLLVIAVAVAVKIFLGRYVIRQGRRVRSSALKAAGTDAFFDAVLSGAVLFSAVLYMIAEVNIEAYVGVVISAFIGKAGIEMILDTLSDLLGRRVDRTLIDRIKSTVSREPEVHGVYDLLLHNYGPDKFLGSLHVEVDENMTAREIDFMSRRIMENVYVDHGVILGGIGIYSRNRDDGEAASMRAKITETVTGHEGVLQVHGLYVDLGKRHVNFDVIIDFDIKDRESVYRHIVEDVKKIYIAVNLKSAFNFEIGRAHV